jgi:uncharacterized phage-associated protein
MAIRQNPFSPEKALESVLYIARLLKAPTVHEVLKMRYFADKIHFSEHGFLGSGDRYVAMSFGPVASSTYDMLKAARGDLNDFTDQRFVSLVQGSLMVERGGKNRVKALREPDLDYLSEADIASIKQAVEKYGNLEFNERTDISHDHAWKEAWDAAQQNQLKQSPMPLVSIAKTLENADEVLAYISE